MDEDGTKRIDVLDVEGFEAVMLEIIGTIFGGPSDLVDVARDAHLFHG
jgi:hypothetical protein